MKKLMMIFTLGTMLFLGACSNLGEFLSQVNAALSTLNGSGNYSKSLPVFKYKGIHLENYRIEVDQERGDFYEGRYKYKFTIKGVLINNYTDAAATIKALIPVYTSDEKLLQIIEIGASAYSTSVENIDTFKIIYTNEPIKFSNELVVTRLYLNTKLVASSNEKAVKSTSKTGTSGKGKTSTSTKGGKKNKEVVNTPQSKGPRAPREAKVEAPSVSGGQQPQTRQPAQKPRQTRQAK